MEKKTGLNIGGAYERSVKEGSGMGEERGGGENRGGSCMSGERVNRVE